MIILHAGVLEEQFLVWGEQPAEAPKRRGKKPIAPPAFPYAASYLHLQRALADIGYPYKHPKRDAREVVVWLPTAGGQAIPSSSIIAAVPSNPQAVRIEPYLVPALSFTPDQMVDLLTRCVGKELLLPGILCGADLAFWGHALRFCAALIARQQFVPDLNRCGDEFRARWRLIVTGEEQERQKTLAQAMPDACRALAWDKHPEPALSKETLLASFCSHLADHLIRGTSIPANQVLITTLKTRIKKTSFDSLHDQWIHALFNPEGIIPGDKKELSQFARQVAKWKHSITIAAEAPFKLCFRLEEPQEDACEPLAPSKSQDTADLGQWYIRYLLQDQRDPTLLLPLDEVWDASSKIRSLFKKAEFNSQEYLLYSLGQASRISKPIESSLKTASPSGYSSTLDEAYQFLCETAPLLQQMHFGVLLPAWWTKKGTKQRMSVRAKVKSPVMKSQAGLSLETLTQFEWEISLGEEILTLKELQQFAKMKASLIKIRGQWVHIHPEEIQEAITLCKQKKNNTLSVRQVIQMALGRPVHATNLEFAGVSATGWIEEL
ncbi:MAG: SNF2 helicase-associated domain-containing protein, partial [bacterium]|nr:SNF2 helicase-associated domain-containing protein [bacterium]